MKYELNFCQRCGQPLSDRFVFGRLRRACPACGFVAFVDPKVAAGVLVQRGREVLLVRRGVEPALGLWALPAGYMEADELPAQTAVRETEEETGLQVRLKGLIDIFPIQQRGIILIYWGEVMSGNLAPSDDVTEAAWFPLDHLPPTEEIAFESTQEALRRCYIQTMQE